MTPQKIRLWLDIGNVFVFYGCFIYWAFCIGYTILAKWWKHESGAHLFAFSFAMAIILSYVSWRIIWPAKQVEMSDLYVRAAVFATEGALATWRLSILVRSQYRVYRMRRNELEREVISERGHPDDRAGPGGLPSEEQR